MTRKQSPRSISRAEQIEPDRWPPKTPPLTRASRHVHDPVGLEPLGDVVMAGNRDESAIHGSAADRFGDGGTADPRHVTIDDAGEFIEGDDRPACVVLL